MPDCFPISVALVVTTRGGRLLVNDGAYIPDTFLRKGVDSYGTVVGLFRGLCGFDAGPWLLLRQVGFDDGPGDHKAVVYAVEMPEAVPVADGFSWADIKELVASDGVPEETLRYVMWACNARAS